MKTIIMTLFLIPLMAWAATAPTQMGQTDYCKQALEHIQAAVTAGEQGNAKGLVKHAEAGLEQAKMAQKPKSSKDVDEAIDSLEQAIKLGKSGEVAKATERAKASAEYIDAAVAALGG